MRVVRHLLKVASWLLTAFVRAPRPDVVMLMYHRVTGDVDLEIDLPFSIFCAQITQLARVGEVVSLDEAAEKLQQGGGFDRTLFVITFDDAYLDFYTYAFPMLQKLGLPVTLYVPSGFIDDGWPAPVSRQPVGASKLQPVTWQMLQEMSKSPLLTIGSHTHLHHELPSLRDDEIEAELVKCDSFLLDKVGQKMRHFAYPRGVWDRRVEKIVKARYATVSLARGGAIYSSEFLPYRIPRVPILKSDGLFWYHARITGRLIYEEIWIEAIKRKLRNLRL